jgi:hypothetical protein
VKLACELPDDAGRSLSTWTCAELARTLRTNGIVDSMSPQSVQRILSSHKLKPWRVHHWLSTKVPHDETFRAQVQGLCDLYTRPLGAHERVLSVDEKTSLQPRTRTSPTRPARPGGTPVTTGLDGHQFHQDHRGPWDQPPKENGIEWPAAMGSRSRSRWSCVRALRREPSLIDAMAPACRDYTGCRVGACGKPRFSVSDRLTPRVSGPVAV